MDILEFKNENFYLSNFYETPIFYKGHYFQSNEAAFQAMKCPERIQEFCELNPSMAKRLGRRVHLRPDWEFVKESVMYEICKQKFLQHPSLAKKLLATGDGLLVEGNDWGDKEWGVCNGDGNNKLGKILMTIREELKNDKENKRTC